jgi:hypothetical protein
MDRPGRDGDEASGVLRREAGATAPAGKRPRLRCRAAIGGVTEETAGVAEPMPWEETIL